MKQIIFSLLILLGFVTIKAQTSDGPKSTDFYNVTIFRGELGSGFGAHAVNIGDFNGDGFDDLAVSARSENNSAGAVYIYFGGENSDMQPDIVFRGTTDWEQLGIFVAGAGDFNGDGHDDLMIATGNYPPTVKLYYGGPNYDQFEDVTFSASYVSAGFGQPMTKLGDINGDGFDDVALQNNTVNIYLGRPDPVSDMMPDYEINGYGNKIAYCGDVNGDGFDDVLIGNGSDPLVNIFGGSDNFDLESDAFIQGQVGSDFGYSVAGGGDINNDGYPDIVIGAPSESVNGMSSVGKVYVAFGSPNIFDGFTFGYSTSFSFSGNVENEYFGHTVAILNDMNGDGFDEIGVGENLGFYSLEHNKVFVYYGGTELNKAPSNVFNSNEKGHLAFYDIASIDFNFDGYGDVVAGDYSFDKVYLFDVANDSPYLFDEVDINLSNNELLYRDISGDFNGDGYNDLLSNFSLYLNQKGTFLSEPSNSFTKEISFAGDINGDGYDDILLTDDWDNSFSICWGNDNNDFTVELVYQETDNLVFAGHTIADFNNDGFSDIVLRICESPFSDENGKLLVFYGGSNLSTEPDFIISHTYPIVAYNTGDFNGDGFDDIIFTVSNGETFYENHIQLGTREGFRSYLYQILSGLNGKCNYSAYKSADYNGDGFDDFSMCDYESDNFYLVLGHPEPYYTEEDIIEIPYWMQPVEINGDGIADGIIDKEIFYGGKNFPNNESQYIPPIFDCCNFSSGDVNNDGFNDLLVKNKLTSTYGIALNTQQNKVPRMISVKDVPADQGGFVTLTWFKSGLDGGKVTSYQVERSIAPVGGDFAWEVIGNVPASRFNYYSYTAPTLNDQTPENTGNTYFRITALTENPDVFYRSNILYGHSVDNLAPIAPGGLKAVREDEEVLISWKLNSESDIKDYLIYRSVNEEVDLDTLEVYGSVTDTVFIDESPLNQSVYYFVRATDIHGNVGDASFVLLQVTGVNDEDGFPKEFKLSQNYPNPFNPTTNITYVIANPNGIGVKQSTGDLANANNSTDCHAPLRSARNDGAVHVSLKVYDILGREVAMLVNAKQAPGNYSVKFNASKLGSGIYFYTLRAGSFVQTKKMILMK